MATKTIDKEVVLHIGMSKAGSSALQQALVKNEGTLKKHGVIYPLTGREWGGAHYTIYNNLEHHNAANVLEDALEEGKDYSTIVFSCENFWFMSDEAIQNLADSLKEYRVRVLLYLRPPHEYLPSSYRQGIKEMGRTHSIQQYLNWINTTRRLDYPGIINTWSQSFSLTVKSYNTFKHNMEEDFFQFLGFKDTSGLHTERQIVNPTLNDTAIRLLLFANRTLPDNITSYLRSLLKSRPTLFSLLPDINNRPFLVHSDKVVQSWDCEKLRCYLSVQEINVLTNANYRGQQ